MNTLRLILCLLLLNTAFQSCNQENAFDCVKSTGPVITQERPISAFQAILIKDNINLILDTTSTQTAIVEAGKNLMAKINFTYKGDTLIIANKNTCEWVRSAKYPVSVTIGTPKENLVLIHEGYGKITSTGTLPVQDLAVFSWEAGGGVDIDIQAKSLTLYSNSHALMNVTGQVDNAFLWMHKGIGRFHTEALQVQTCTVKHEGSNEIRVHPLNELRVEILQSGSVAYYHEPAKITSYIRGTGKLIKR
jgi:hypothetical protein